MILAIALIVVFFIVLIYLAIKYPLDPYIGR
jgi:hypothetical protein